MKRLLLLSTLLPFSGALGNPVQIHSPGAAQNYGDGSAAQAQHQSIKSTNTSSSSAIGNTGTIKSTARGGTGGSGGSVSIGSVNASSNSLRPPDVSLPGLASSGQCGIVGGGPGMSLGGGGGGFLFARESPNCRNWYIALAWIQTGLAIDDKELVKKGERLMADITSEAHDAYYPAPVEHVAAAATDSARVQPEPIHERVKPEWCYTASVAEKRRHVECK